MNEAVEERVNNMKVRHLSRG